MQARRAIGIAEICGGRSPCLREEIFAIDIDNGYFQVIVCHAASCQQYGRI
jgi:hypothetical protein